MKRMFALTLALTLGLAACGGAGDTIGTAPGGSTGFTPGMVPISYSASNLVVSGSTILQGVVASYTSVADPTLKSHVRHIADFFLFPTGDIRNQTFSQRMEATFTGDDNVVKILQLQQTLSNGGALPLTGASRPARGLVEDEPFDGYNECIGAVGAGIDCLLPGLGSVFTSIFGGPSEEEQFRKRVENQLKALDKKLDRMQAEMRQGFKQMDTRFNQVLGNMQDLKGDVNILNSGVGSLISLHMGTTMNDFDGFLANYGTAVNTNEARTIVHNYFVESSDFNQNILNFIDCAKAIQEWATNNNQFTAWAHEDATRATNVHKMTMYCEFHPGHSHDLLVRNPKRLVTIGMGNLEYLAKMMFTKLNLNSVIYHGANLRQKNQLDAQYFLGLLESSGIKQMVLDLAAAMQQDRTRILGVMAPEFAWNGSNYDYIAMRWDGAWKASVTCKPWNDGSEIDGGSVMTPWVDKQIHNSYMGFCGLSLARLAAIEVLLTSYL